MTNDHQNRFVRILSLCSTKERQAVISNDVSKVVVLIDVAMTTEERVMAKGIVIEP